MKLTAIGNGQQIAVKVQPDKIVGLAPTPDGGCTVTIPTRSFTVTESIDRVLELWLGPANGDAAATEEKAR